jgi:hypothetical protein
MKIRVFVVASFAVSILAAVAGLAAANQSAPSSQPIEGYWTYGTRSAGSSLLFVRPTATGFEAVGNLGVPNTFVCLAPRGTPTFRVSGSGTHYTGEHLWYRYPPCEHRFAADGVLDLDGPDTGQICSTHPWDRSFRECSSLTRGCAPGVGAATGASACVPSGSKAAARLASLRWTSAAAIADRLLRRLRGGDRRRLRSLGTALARYERTQATVFGVIAKDPPDSNYHRIAQPQRLRMLRGRPSARRLLLRNFAQANAVGQALTTTIDRAAGARLAGDFQALGAQNAAAISHAQRLAALLQRQPRLARRVARKLRPRSANGRRLVRQLRAPAFAARVALCRRVLQAFVAQNR